MKKEKKLKLTYSNDQAIIHFKNAVNSHIQMFRAGTFEGYEQVHNKEQYTLYAVFACSGYKFKIIYKSSVGITEENYIDCVYDINGREVTIYDIFNLFNINDFTQYYYKECIGEQSIINAVDKVLDLTEKYDYDLKKACEDTYFVTLCTNMDLDHRKTYNITDEDEQDEDDDDSIDVLGLKLTHPFFSEVPGPKTAEKKLKKLEKLEKKDKIDTIYEKRFLEYLRNGNTYVDENASAEKKSNSTVLKLDVITTAICLILGLAMSVLIVLGFKTAFFAGGYFSDALVKIPVINVSLSLFDLADIVWTSIFFGATCRKIVGKLIFAKLCVGNSSLVAKYNHQNDEYTRKKRKKSKLPGAIICFIIGFVGCFIAGADGVGFYDDGVKFAPADSLIPIYVSYNDLEIYSVEMIYDDEDNLVKAENDYAICDNNGNAYDLYEIEENGELEKMLYDIVEKYNKEIKSVKNFDDLLPDYDDYDEYENIDEEFNQ